MSATAYDVDGNTVEMNGSISQSITFTTAGSYYISFYAAQRGGYDWQSFDVLVDGTSVGSFTPDGTSYAEYSTSDFSVTAGTHTITFLGLDPGGTDDTALIDDVTAGDGTGTTATPPTFTDAGFEMPEVGTGSYYDFAYQPPPRESYTYDALGDEVGYTDRNGTTHAYSYNMQGQLTSDDVTTFGVGVDQTVSKLGYSYNDQGLMAAATSYNGGGGVVNQVAESYDGFGQLLTDAQAVSGNVSGGTPTVSYSYDTAADDRLTSITYPDGQVVNYGYGGNGGLDTILDRITNISSGSISQAYTYLGLDTPVTFTDGNGVELSYLGTVGSTGGDAGDQYVGLDRFGRIVGQNWTNSSGAGVDQFDYGYNGDGDVTYEQTVTNTSSGTTNTNLAATSQLYTYDNLNRLINYSTGTMNVSGGTATMVTATGEESWDLDAVGNWESSTVNNSGGTVTTNRNNSAQNQVTSVGDATLYYDADGNTTVDQNGQEYVYDAWNRLVEVANSDGEEVAGYTYDALGRQMIQTDDGVTTDLYNSNQDQVLQENQGSLVTATHVWSPFYVDAMIATETNPEVTTNQSNGSVDTGFGTNTSNHTTTTALTSSPTFALAAVDGSDTLVATMNGSGSTPTLLFYNSSGGLDSSYGSGGMVSLSGLTITAITGLVVQSDGYIDLAVQNTSGGLIVVQLNTSGGSVDGSFGTSGVESLGSLPAAQGLVQALNGDLMVDGTSGAAIEVTALNPSTGSPDGSFNSSGTAYVTVNSNASSISLGGMSVAPDGDLILAGSFDYTSGFEIFKGTDLAAVNPQGNLDSSFGTSGIANVSFGSEEDGLFVSSQGKIFLDDYLIIESLPSGAITGYYDVSEFNSNGSSNTSFNGGTASVTISNYSGSILNVEPNGQVVVGIGETNGPLTLVRFNANGSLDTTFGSSGIEFGANESTGLAMVTAVNGETIMIGTPASGSGIILQEFGTLSAPQVLYPTYDANYDITSLTNSSGGVLERYTYTPYGTVTVLSASGAVQGDGTAASSFYGWVYFDQGLRLDVVTGNYFNRNRIYDPSLGRFLQEDPAGYVNGPNMYQREMGNPLTSLDPTGLRHTSAIWDIIRNPGATYAIGLGYHSAGFVGVHTYIAIYRWDPYFGWIEVGTITGEPQFQQKLPPWGTLNYVPDGDLNDHMCYKDTTGITLPNGMSVIQFVLLADLLANYLSGQANYNLDSDSNTFIHTILQMLGADTDPPWNAKGWNGTIVPNQPPSQQAPPPPPPIPLAPVTPKGPPTTVV